MAMHNTFVRSAISFLVLGSVAMSVNASPGATFQTFLFDACNTATGELLTRCQDSFDGQQNGNLSGDSEDSLAPTQALSNGANALAATKARIKALAERMANRRDGEAAATSSGREVVEQFQMEGYSLLFQVQHGNTDREVTDLERGYETDSFSVRVGADYRLKDNWLLGAMVGIDRQRTDFDADAPGRNFSPASKEGASDVDNLSLSVFSTYNVGENFYVEGLVSLIFSDYTFERNVIFQESSRTTPQTSVNTVADTDGTQVDVSLAAGYDFAIDATDLGVYGRLEYQDGRIDDYTETGGAGFAMHFEEQDTDAFSATIGVRMSRAYSTQTGVLVPQVSFEYYKAFDQTTPKTTANLVLDASNNQLTYVGDEPDDSYFRLALGLSGVAQNGIMGFIRYEQDIARDHIDDRRISAGVRIEY